MPSPLWPSCALIRRVVFGSALALVLGTLGLQPAAASVGPSFTPNPAAVTAGGSAVITLNDSVIDTDTIGAVDLLVTFDQTLLSFDSVGAGSLLGGWTVAPPNSPSAGQELISIAECPLCSDAAGFGSIVTLTFDALSGDPTTSTFFTVQTTDDATDVSGEYQLSPLASEIDITAGSTPVPAPGLAVFVLPALVMLRTRMRRA